MFTIEVKTPDYWAKVSDAMEETGGQVAFFLTWGDYVANDWAEAFDNLSDALTRLALLVECDTYERVFRFDEYEHEQHSQKFLNSNTQEK